MRHFGLELTTPFLPLDSLTDKMARNQAGFYLFRKISSGSRAKATKNILLVIALDKDRRARIERIEISHEDVNERPVQISIYGLFILPKITQPVNIGLSRRSVSLLQLAPGSLHNRIDNKRLGRLQHIF